MSDEEQRLARACLHVTGETMEEEEAQQAAQELRGRAGVENVCVFNASDIGDESQEGFVVYFEGEGQQCVRARDGGEHPLLPLMK